MGPAIVTQSFSSDNMVNLHSNMVLSRTFKLPFFTGQPNGGAAENCIGLKESFGYDWFDEDCTDMNPFICWIEGGA